MNEMERAFWKRRARRQIDAEIRHCIEQLEHERKSVESESRFAWLEKLREELIAAARMHNRTAPDPLDDERFSLFVVVLNGIVDDVKRLAQN